MSLTGLLILSMPFSSVSSNLRMILSRASDYVSKTLYVHLCLVKGQHLRAHTGHSAGQMSSLKTIRLIYMNAHVSGANMDVRVPLDSLKQQDLVEKRGTQFAFDVVLTDHGYATADVKSFLSYRFFQNVDNVRIINLLPSLSIDDDKKKDTAWGNDRTIDVTKEQSLKQYRNVVIGGTFDRLHAGHKIFLSEAAMRCSQRLTVGVTDEKMLTQKILPELIEPTSFRIETVLAFLRDIDPSISYRVVPISDPFGPSIDDPSLECVVVSEETVKGGHKINEVRTKKGLPPLDICTVMLIEDINRFKGEEVKISSSSLRMRSLGKRLRTPEKNTNLPKKPYIIGLTGGIASGKSNICKHLTKLGAGVAYSDQMAHAAYKPGSKAFQQIVEYFGDGVVASSGDINRQELGKLVFGNSEKLEKLNSIVWPEVEKLLKSAVMEFAQEGKSVIVLEIPLLIESGMTRLVHEVWVALIPPQEAVRRIQERDRLTDEEATRRVNSQMTDKERISHAHVAFCSLWDPEYTRRQVEMAWTDLQSFLESDS